MSKLALLFICVFLVSLCSADFSRPWENRTWVASNPYIWSYGIEVWYGLDGLHKTPGSIDSL